MAKLSDKKKNKSWPIIIQLIIGGIIGLIGGIFMVSKLFTNEWDIMTLLSAVIFMFIAVFINVNIHEFGHFIFGKIFGYRLMSYRISFLTWNYENGKMKFSIIKNKGYSGLCAMVPPEHEVAVYKNIIFYAGGILFNIFSAFIFLVSPYLFSNLPYTIKLFLVITGSLGLLLGITNFMPFISGNNPTDGKLIWSMILKKPFAKKLIEINKMTSQLSAGIRPKDIQISPPENLDNPEIYDIMTILYLYFKALDNKDLNNMLHYANLLEKNLDAFPYPALPGLYYELCFIGCITDDATKAKRYCEKSGKILQNDKDINGLRVKAYYEYHINKNEKAAIDFCESAIVVESKFPIKGQGMMERDLVEALKELIESNPGGVSMDQDKQQDDCLTQSNSPKTGNKRKVIWKTALVYVFIVTLLIISMQIRPKFMDSKAAVKVYELSVEGNYDEALAYLDKKIEKDPDNFSYYNLKGSILMDLGEEEKALINYDKALELNPKDVDSLNSKSSYYYSVENYEEAFDNAERALKISPIDGDAMMNKAYAMQGMELYAESIELFDKALTLNQNTECLLGKATSLHYMDRNEEAIDVLKEYLEIVGEDSYAYYYMAEANFMLDKYEEAMKYYDKAIENDPENPFYYYAKADTYVYFGDNDKAIEYYKKVLKVDPVYSDAYYGISRIYSVNGNKKLAIEYLKTALKYDITGELKNTAAVDYAFDSIKLSNEFIEVIKAK
jgi:tetratricopeptide (TPR) repeat protein